MTTRNGMLAVALCFTAVAMPACDRDAPTVADLNADAIDVPPVLHEARSFGAWAPVIRVEDIPGTHPTFNTDSLDGCPFIAADNRTFYMASTRTGGYGGIDIWVSTRKSPRHPWGAPVNLGPPINTAANDFCPTLAADGRTFYFASNRAGGCGGDDLYITRRHAVKATRHDEDDGDSESDRKKGRYGSDTEWVYEQPRNLGCDVNSSANEAGPSPVYERGIGLVLYYSSVRPGGFTPEPAGALSGDSDLYRSVWRGGAFGPSELVPGVNSASNDGQPNVRHDAREIFFFSNRPGAQGNDIYAASRDDVRDDWSAPYNLGPNVNSEASETRPSLSLDGRTLYIGSDRVRPTAEGKADHYVTTRPRVPTTRDD